MWSYDIEGIATGAVPTSPVLSLDGKKVAFVESAAGAAHFDVLAWKSGDGVATNKQNVLVLALQEYRVLSVVHLMVV